MVLRALTYGLFLVGPLALLGGQAGQDFRDGRPASACSIADLGPATPSSHLRSINNRGQIIAPGRQSRGAAALLDSAEPGSEAIDIDNLHTVHGINNVGQVAGAIFSPGRGRRAGLGFISGQAYELRGSPDSTCEDLGETINVSWACDINDRGQVVGIYTVRNTQYRGFFWDRATGMHDLGVLLRQRVYSADAINNDGAIVGRMADHGAFYWSQATGTIYMCPGCESEPTGVNNRGWVVGQYRTSQGLRAFLWHQSVGMVDLNDLLPANSAWILCAAADINDEGQIVGWGSLHGQDHNFLLTIPELHGSSIARFARNSPKSA